MNVRELQSHYGEHLFRKGSTITDCDFGRGFIRISHPVDSCDWADSIPLGIVEESGVLSELDAKLSNWRFRNHKASCPLWLRISFEQQQRLEISEPRKPRAYRKKSVQTPRHHAEPPPFVYGVECRMVGNTWMANTERGKALLRHKNAMSQIVERLEGMGYVRVGPGEFVKEPSIIRFFNHTLDDCKFWIISKHRER